MKDFKNKIKEMIVPGDYSPRICDVLILIVEDKMNSIEFNNYSV